MSAAAAPYKASLPFDWWWSGKLWYCRVHPKVLSGAGPTKPQAAHDAMREFKKVEYKQTFATTTDGSRP